MNQLVDYILDGDADKLKDRSSDDEEVQELIDGVPKFEVVLIVWITVTCIYLQYANQQQVLKYFYLLYE